MPTEIEENISCLKRFHEILFTQVCDPEWLINHTIPGGYYIFFKDLADWGDLGNKWNDWVNTENNELQLNNEFGCTPILLPLGVRDSIRYLFTSGHHIAIDKRAFGMYSIGFRDELISNRWIETSLVDQETKVEELQKFAIDSGFAPLPNPAQVKVAFPNNSSNTYWYYCIGFHLPEYAQLYPPMTTAQTVTMTLEECIKKLTEENPETYFENAHNKLHGELANQYFNFIVTNKLPQFDSNATEQFLAQVETLLGYRLEKLDPSTGHYTTKAYPLFLPRKHLKSYYNHKGTLQWLPAAVWEKLHQGSRIQWCSFHKNWFIDSAFVTINSASAPKTLAVTEKHPVEKIAKLCHKCSRLWMKQEIKTHPATEQDLCAAHYEQITETNPETQRFNPIGDYHSHNGIWTFYIQRSPTKEDRNTLPIGVELEIQAKGGAEAVANPREWRNSGGSMAAMAAAYHIREGEKAANPKWHNFYAEWDGSLNNGGFEIITNPMTTKIHQEYWSVMLPIINEVANGWDVTGNGTNTKDQYGIHLTTARKYWTDMALARLAYFLTSANNKDFVHAIAQRAVIYGSPKEIATTPKPVFKDVFVKNKKGIVESNRDLLYLKGSNLVELRIFRSTLNVQSFLKNIEFLDTFRQWALNSPWNYHHAEYLKWLNKTQSATKYPNLFGYLSSKDKFACKFRKNFQNPFKEFFKEVYVKGQVPLFPLTLAEIPPDRLRDLEDEADLLRDQ